MKKEGDKAVDHIFNQALGGAANAGYREEDWNALELMLDKQKKRPGLVFWLPILSSAAILLIAFGWWLSRPYAVIRVQRPQIAVRPARQSVNKAIYHADKAAFIAKTETAVNKVSAPLAKHQPVESAPDRAVMAAQTNPDTALLAANTANDKSGMDNTSTVANAGSRSDAAALLAATPGFKADTSVPQQDPDLAHAALAGVISSPVISPVKQSKAAVKPGFFVHPQYALSVIGAPEVNGINSLSQGRSGTNIGLLFSVGVLNKLTLSTGALYSTKPYNAYNAGYANSHVNSAVTSIDADCRVLDIPINLDYQLYNRHQNKFSIGSGLSSYIMLHESYRFNYNDPSVYGPYNYTVPRDNKYALSILNLQATYTRQVTSSVGLSLQPYMKLPLTGIGVYQGKLQSAGLAIGLSWNINAASKP